MPACYQRSDVVARGGLDRGRHGQPVWESSTDLNGWWIAGGVLWKRWREFSLGGSRSKLVERHISNGGCDTDTDSVLPAQPPGGGMRWFVESLAKRKRWQTVHTYA